MELTPKYENFDFSGDLKNLQTSVLGNDLTQIKSIIQKQNLDDAQKQYLENHLGNFLNSFLQKAKADENSYSWNSWNIIKDLNLQNFDNPNLKTLANLANQDENFRKNNLPNFLATNPNIQIFDTTKNIPNGQNPQSQAETQMNNFPTHFAIQKKTDGASNEGKYISLFGYNTSTPTINKLLTQKQNDFIIGFNNLLLEGKNQTIDRQKFLSLAQNYGLEKGNYTFFVENNLGAEPFINIAYGDNIGISFGKNVLPSYDHLIPLAQEVGTTPISQTSPTETTPTQQTQSPQTHPTAPNSPQTTIQTNLPTQVPTPSPASQPVSQPTPDPKNHINAPDPNLKTAPAVKPKPSDELSADIKNTPIISEAQIQNLQKLDPKFFEQKKSQNPAQNPAQKTTPKNLTTLDPSLEKDLTEVTKNSLTAIDLAKLKDKDFVKIEPKAPVSTPNPNTPKTAEKGVGGDIGNGSPETKRLKTLEQKKQYLEKLFDGKTSFNIPNSQKIVFETGSENLGNTFLEGGKFYLKGVTLREVEGDYLVYADVTNITYNGNQTGQYKTHYRVNLGELNQVLSQIDSWKNAEPNPYSQMEVGEYNSNKIYNQMLAIINMQQNQMSNGGIKNGENFSYLKYFDVKNLLASGQALPGYYTKNGKSGDEVGTVDGGGICASANLLARTLGLGTNGATLWKYEPIKDKNGKIVDGKRNPVSVSLGSAAPDIFSSFNFANHSQQYYNITSDNPLTGTGRNYDATVSSNGPDISFKNNSGKTLYIHMKATILDGGRLKDDPRAQGNKKMMGLYDNSTTWFNQCWIDETPPSHDEINHNREQFRKFIEKRKNFMSWPKDL